MLSVCVSSLRRMFPVAVCLVLAAAPNTWANDPPWLARGRQGMVASDSPHASRAGLEILKAGGNAIDAAAAVSFALAVTRPYSTGLGGGGFMIARFADGRVVVQDFRERAPAAATPGMYTKIVQRDAKQPEAARYGHLAVAVPGLVAGRCQALTRHGTLPLDRVMAPAIRLARDGYPVDKDYVENASDTLDVYEKYPSLKERCAYVYQTHVGGGHLHAVGDVLTQPKLARLLEGVAKDGADFFYRGPVAKAMAREMKAGGGIITEKDLADYRVRDREPIRSTYRGYEVIGMPPPSSGGIALAETLSILATLDLPSVFRSDPGLAVHYQIEAMKHAFADRARWLGDSDFAEVPTDLLVSTTYAEQLAALLKPSEISDVDAYGCTRVPDDSGTSHFSVVDRWGNVVASTETINTTFGSFAAVDEWGLILNDEMDDFAAVPDKPNAYGLVQSSHNQVEPGKRPLSSMTPTIMIKDGKPVLALGASGGPRIISSVLNVLLGVTDYGLTLEQAMLHLRPHHQWQPNEVYFDAKPGETITRALSRRGHDLSDRRRWGVVQAIRRTKEGWVGASDPRKGGRPAGY